jgi:drug/metabolite transporter (DMT)-like permease
MRQAYAFVTGALTSALLLIALLIHLTANGDEGAWDYWLGVAFAVVGVAFVIASATWISVGSRQNAHR